MADLSPLTLGHLLLLPLEHVPSFGHVIRQLEAEVGHLLNTVGRRYVRAFGPYSILEHGSSSSMDVTCISHAHWHMLPIAARKIDAIMRRDGLVAVELRSMCDLSEFAEADRTYFYFSDGTAHTVFGVDKTAKRQYLRSVVGEIVGIPEPLWDYALVVRTELLRRTIALTDDWDLLDRDNAESSPH